MGQSVGEGVWRDLKLSLWLEHKCGGEFELGRGQIMQGFKSYTKDLVHYTN